MKPVLLLLYFTSSLSLAVTGNKSASNIHLCLNVFTTTREPKKVQLDQRYFELIKKMESASPSESNELVLNLWNEFKESHAAAAKLEMDIDEIATTKIHTSSIRGFIADAFSFWNSRVSAISDKTPLTIETFKGPWTSVYLDLVDQAASNPLNPFSKKLSRIETFRKKMLPLIKNQGIKVVYFLPTLFEGPRLDGGFDVQNPFGIAPDLGTLSEFKALVKELRENKIAAVLDTPANHLSDQSPLFQGLLAGDLSKRDYFITADKKPEIIETKGNMITYRIKDSGGTYERELPFSNVVRDHWHSHEIPVYKISKDGRRLKTKATQTIWVYSTFYHHQIDLNLQNPKALGLWVNFIGFWSAVGVSGFRGDAAQWWIKSEGQNGKNQMETYAVHRALFKFMKLLNPEVFYLPETVADLSTTATFVGGLKNDQEHPYRSQASGVYLLQLAEYLRSFAITGNFSKAYEQLKEIQYQFPDEVYKILPLQSHDEYYLGFLKRWSDDLNDMTSRLYNQVKAFFGRTSKAESFTRKGGNGIVYKDGNSGAGSLYQILGPRLYRFYYKFCYGMDTVPYSQFGAELGLGHNWIHLYGESLNRLKAEGKPDTDPDVLRIQAALTRPHPNEPPPEEWDQATQKRIFADARPLGRYTVTSDSNLFLRALAGFNRVFNFSKNLTRLRSETPALWSGKMKMLDTYDSEVGAYLRLAPDAKDASILVIGNGSEKAKTVNVSIGMSDYPAILELASQKEFINILDNKKITISDIKEFETNDGYTITFIVPAKEVFWLNLNSNAPETIQN